MAKLHDFVVWSFVVLLFFSINSLKAQDSDISDTIVDIQSLRLGSNVFQDNNGNSKRDTLESGIADLKLDLFQVGHDSIPQTEDDVLINSAYTNEEGNYVFENLHPGSFYIFIEEPDKSYPLSSNDIWTTFDPNNDVDKDDNGLQFKGIGNSVRSNVIDLSFESEPLLEDGPGGQQDADDDWNGNMTLDFGFSAAGGDEPEYDEPPDWPVDLEEYRNYQYPKMKAKGSGKSTGKIGELVVHNPNNREIIIKLGPYLIPSKDDFQGYVIQKKCYKILAAGETIVYPLEGYCYNVHLSPIPKNDELPPYEEWIKEDDFEYTYEESAAVENVAENGNSVVPSFKDYHDFESRIAEAAPFLINAANSLETSYGNLKSQNKIVDVYPNDAQSQQEGFIQQCLWQYSADLQNEKYRYKDFEKVILNQAPVQSWLSGQDGGEAGNKSELKKEIKEVWACFDGVIDEADLLVDGGVSTPQTGSGDKSDPSLIWGKIVLVSQEAKLPVKVDALWLYGAAGLVGGGLVALTAGAADVEGCTNVAACNYNEDATADDGSCLFLDCNQECGGTVIIGSDCDDGNDCTINDVIIFNCDCLGIFLDEDNDGVCDLNDICPGFDDNQIGNNCDDGNVCTTNDVITEDCICEGEFEDTDKDGICDALDSCPDFDNNLIGTSCDDLDECTVDDIYIENCSCIGTYVDSDTDGICDAFDECPDLDDSLVGTACNDGDDCTINDVYLETCDCEGVFADIDGDGVCDADDDCPDLDNSLIGTACDDGNDCSINDVYLITCDCAGTIEDADGDGVCDAEDVCPGFDDNLIGTVCDDGDDCTVGDTYQADCNCEGVFQDSDGDDICDFDDVCPGFDDNLFGSACDDGDDCTFADEYTFNCVCEGILQDSDGDGVCDADDVCPGFDDGLIGTACDDGDPCTENDTWANDCTCTGDPIFINADIQTEDTSCDEDNGVAFADVTPPGNYSYVWNGNPGSDLELFLAPGPGQLEVIDDDSGCANIFNFNVAQGTSPILFEVVQIDPDMGDGMGVIVIDLNNIYDGPYEVCWNGMNTGTNGCQGPLSNGLFMIDGPADIYTIQVEILNGAGVPCIHTEIEEIPLLPPVEELTIQSSNSARIFFGVQYSPLFSLSDRESGMDWVNQQSINDYSFSIRFMFNNNFYFSTGGGIFSPELRTYTGDTYFQEFSVGYFIGSK